MKTARKSICGLGLIALIFLLPGSTSAVGTWTKVTRSAPGAVSLMLLLSDGTVMAANSSTSTSWYRLTPDSSGSYINGTWSTLTGMHDTRLYYSSCVLTNGQVFVAGGEYGTGYPTSEVYDPVGNLWTIASVPTSLLNPANQSPEVGETQGFSDSPCKILPNGSVLVAPVAASNVGGSLIYYPASNTWSNGPVFFRTGYPDQAEASWVRLPDDSVLTINPFGTTSERYIPSLNKWINDASIPVAIYSSLGGEIGPGLNLADGRAFYLGGSGHTLLYTPTGNTNVGTWTAGPDIPAGLTASDAPAAVLPNGKVLCAVGPALTTNSSGSVIYSPPTTFYEFDPIANTFTLTGTPTGTTANYASYVANMVMLPNGSVLYSRFSSTMYVYQPDGSPLATNKPTIKTITQNTDGSYQLSGTLLNGVSAGAAYGDDNQMDSNYPIIRITNSAGNVAYARTYNWNSTTISSGTNVSTTQFVLPTGVTTGNYTLVVTANGIASDPVTLTLPQTLQIRKLTGEDKTVLSWPTLPSNAMLETSSNLVGGSWSPLTNNISIVGNNSVLTNNINRSSVFFRLHLQWWLNLKASSNHITN